LSLAAEFNALMCYDNVSFLPQWFSDALASLATGSGFGCRKFHCQDDEVIFGDARPIIINGIPDFAESPDLLDRAIKVTMRPIAERRTDEEVRAAFEALGPANDHPVHVQAPAGEVGGDRERRDRQTCWGAGAGVRVPHAQHGDDGLARQRRGRAARPGRRDPRASRRPARAARQGRLPEGGDDVTNTDTVWLLLDHDDGYDGGCAGQGNRMTLTTRIIRQPLALDN
jgi:hypothetical protein